MFHNNKKIYFMLGNKKIRVEKPAENIALLSEPVVFSRGHFDNAPWITPYYFETRVTENDDIIVPFYVSDHNQIEWLEEDYSKRFQVVIKFNGKTFVKNVHAGDHAINIGKCSTFGEQYLTMYATDMDNNIRTFEHIIHLLCVSSVAESNIYTMTAADLASYSLNNTASIVDEDMTNNIDGLNRLLADKKAAGYTGIKLLAGTYNCNMGNTRDRAIVVPSEFTLDLNGGKIKQKYTGKGHSSLIVKIDPDAIDSHIINGIIEGDFDEHTDLTVPEGETYWVEGEGYNSVSMGGAFCSLENVTVQHVTGYSITSGLPSLKKGTTLAMNATDFTPTAINLEDGTEFDCEGCLTSKTYGTINHSFRFMSANTYAGYGGYSGYSEIVYFHFYDTDKNYMYSVKGRQFSLTPTPENASYVRVTLLGDSNAPISPGSGVGFSLEHKNYLPMTCSKLLNVHSYNTRTCAMATGIMNFLLVEGCTFQKCGQRLKIGTVTAVAIDIEDGYQYGANYFFRNNQFIEDESGLGSSVVIMTTGHNSVFENTNMDLVLRGNVGLTLRNQTFSRVEIARSSYLRSAFQRVYDCTFTKDLSMILGSRADGSQDIMANIVKNCTFKGSIQCAAGNIDWSHCHDITFKDCNYIGTGIGRCTMENCDISVSGINITTAIFKNCHIYSRDTSKLGVLRGTLTITDNCIVDNLTIESNRSSDKGIITNSQLNNVQIFTAYYTDGQQFDVKGCTINCTNRAFYRLANYSVGYPITIDGNTINTDYTCVVEFYDDREHTSEGYVTKPFTLSNNIITGANIVYVIKGIHGNTTNAAILVIKGNTFDGAYYNPAADTNANITIITE